MKKCAKLASLVLFFATGAMISMEQSPKVIIQNEAWSYGLGGGYYDLKVSINDSKEEIQVVGGKSKVVGDLNGINQINIRRSGAGSGWVPSMVGVSTIKSEELNVFKQEAHENPGKDVTLVIGATSTGYAVYTHFWGKPMQGAEESNKHDPWSAFPEAKAAMEKLNVNFFNDQEQRSKLLAVAKLILGFDVKDNPDKSTIEKRYRKLSLQYHPDRVKDLTASMIFDKFADQAYAIIVRAYKILMPSREVKFDETWQK